MASNIFTSAGTKLYVSSDAFPADATEGNYQALSWTEVGEIESIGEFGKEYNEVTYVLLGDRRTIKRKGSYNDGELSINMGRVPSDVGQAILVVALDSDDTYAFAVVLQDGTVLFFGAQVRSYKTNVGNADQITAATCMVSLTEDIISSTSLT